MKKDKINIIIFSGNFLPHIGGLETHVNEFSKYLSKNKRYNITIISPDITCNAKKKEIIHNGVKVLRYDAFEIAPNFPIPKFWKISFYKTIKKLYQNNYEIVMTRTRFFTNSFLGLFFSKFRFKKIQLIHVEHGSNYIKVENKLTNLIAYLYDRTIGLLVFKLADKNIAISKAVYDFMRKEFLKKEKIQIIKRGIDFEVLKNSKFFIEFNKKFEDKIKIGYIGRLYKWKGVANSIEAYKDLPKKIRKKSVFLIGGYGEEEINLKKLAGKYLNNGIYFLGKLEFSKSYSIMKGIDIYLHSSYKGGGLASSLLQFMYFETTIVASPNEGANEVIRNNENGILLKNNSIKELKKGLILALKNIEIRKKYSKIAKETIESNFNWKEVIKKYDNVFEEVLSK